MVQRLIVCFMAVNCQRRSPTREDWFMRNNATLPITEIYFFHTVSKHSILVLFTMIDAALAMYLYELGFNSIQESPWSR